MQKRGSIAQATGRQRPRRVAIPGVRYQLCLAFAVVFLPLFAMQMTVNPAAADSAYDPVSFEHPFSIYSDPSCPTGTYTVPYNARFVEIVAVGGAGSDGSSTQSLDFQYGGKGGLGAKVTAIIPVTPRQTLSVLVARPGGVNYEHDHSGWPNGGISEVPYQQGGGSTLVSTQTFSTAASCKSGIDRNQVLLLAGGGGGGGAAGSFGSGGNGGNAGGADWNGELGAAAYHLDSDCDYGRGASGGSQTAPGYYGAGGCSTIGNGEVGNGFFGGNSSWFTGGGSSGGAGGGGWYGGGSGGPSGGNLGAGGGGAGSSYIKPTNYPVSISQDTSGKPIVTITPLAVPTTTATLTGTTTDNTWYTSTLTVKLAASAGTYTLDKTYYALDDPGCSAANVHALARCTEYTGPFTISSGAHTLTYFSIDAKGLDEGIRTSSFVVTPTSNIGVTAAKIGTGTNPTATAGGAAGVNGSISVSGTGSGVVGAAVYQTNPVGAPIFKSSGAYVDVIASSGLTALTFKDCKLDGGINVYWWNGTAWALASNQTYDPATKCVTVRVDSTTVPTVSQLTGTVIAAGSPPSITAVATTADGKPYSAGVWTNQAITVAFVCSANATPTAPVTRASEGQNQTASGTCTDGLGQQATTTFTGINIDQTPPACTIPVSPSVIWPPNGKPVAIAGTVTLSDNRSGVAGVIGAPVTSNEGLSAGEVQGFVVNTTYAQPLTLSTAVKLNGTLVAKRAGNGSGRSYAQVLTVTDQAGNTANCSWTVLVPHDQQNGR